MSMKRNSGITSILGLALALGLGGVMPVAAQVTVTQVVESTSGPYGLGAGLESQVDIVIRLAETVTNVTPALEGGSSYPRIRVRVAPANGYATFQSRVGTNGLLFRYTVRPGDFAEDMDTIFINGLELGPSTIVTSGGTAGPFQSFDLPSGGGNSLRENGNINIRTVVFSVPPATDIPVYSTETWLITRDSSGVGSPLSGSLTLTVQSPPTPPAGVDVSYPASVVISNSAREVNFPVQGLNAGGPFVFRLRPAGYPTNGAGDLVVTNVMVIPGSAPTFSISAPMLPLVEGDPPVAETHSCTLTLSQPAFSNVVITLTNSAPAKLQIVGSGQVTIAAGQSQAIFLVQALDGPDSITVGGTASHTYSQGTPAVVTTLNVDPVLNDPPEEWEPSPGSEGFPVSFSWAGTDVVADRPTLYAIIAFGDGTDSGPIVGQVGSVNHTYTTPGTRTVTVRFYDKDGGVVTRSGEIEILPSTQVVITERIHGVQPGFLGLPGLGLGTIDDDDLLTARVSVGGRPNVWNIKYSPTAPSTTLNATPAPITISTNTFDSFFHVWIGDGFANADSTEPIANEVAVLLLDGQDRDVSGVFSREFAEADNYGDIDHDGLPDQWELLWWPGENLFHTPNSMENPDEDFLPRGADPVTLAYPAETRNYAPDGADFGHILEVRGLDLGLNAVNSDASGPLDEPRYAADTRDFFGTDPTDPDTDGDGMDDGWEYYFWMNAAVQGVTGVRYDPLLVYESFDVIPADEIAAAFDPLVPGGGDSDLDGDGIVDLEEYALGTDPIHWDTDNDGMLDGWEVFRSLNPFTGDGAGNPDGDYFAALDWDPTMLRPKPIPPDTFLQPLLGDVHYRVYDAEEYDPRTGWGASYTERDRGTGAPQPDTTEMLNIDEYAIMRFWIDELTVGTEAGIPANPDAWNLYSSNPLNCDTDGDGAPDGWEAYVHFDPCLPQALPAWDLDGDGLTLPQEFGGQETPAAAGGAVTATIDAETGAITYSEMVPMTNPNDRWWNKFWPTDPNNADTDTDNIGDSGEGSIFMYESPEGWSSNYIRGARSGGGMNPCSVDTDMDFIPDTWEIQFAFSTTYAEPPPARDTMARRVQFMNPDGSMSPVEGMDGSIFDSKSGMTMLTGQEENYDFDGDGLENFQEYYVNAIWHFNYDKWVAGLGAGGYDPALLFLGAPKDWDWAIAANYWQIFEGSPPPFHTPFIYIVPEPRPFMLAYASADPSLWDSDFDGMDDHYEMFYGLNPLLSETTDYVSKGLPSRNPDIRVQPWIAGEALADPDQDGIPNWEEAIFPGRPAPYNLHTDPSPYWVTDVSYEESWVNLYYRPGSQPWYWAPPVEGTPPFPYPSMMGIPPPSYLYSFANTEGFDTDNDNIPDKMEVTGADQVGTTDPGDFDSPRLRKALYLDGQSAARNRFGSSHDINQLRSWTVELWARPEQPQSPTGARQILIERPVQLWSTDPMPAPELVRRNFRVGLEANGMPFAEYNNSGNDVLTETIRGTGYILQSNLWYHIAATMNGLDKQFSLYVNGVLVARQTTALIPATGVLDANPPLLIPAPIVVGAADRNPYGRVEPSVPDLVTPPDLHLQFKGWVDEIRVWDGARTQAQIESTRMQRFGLDDVVATMTNYAAVVAAATNLDVNPPDMGYGVASNLPAVVLYHYTFDNLPDPTYEPVSPQAFDLLNGRPSDGTYPGIPWWWQAQDRSRVYSDYQFVHWAENTPSHVPALPQFNRFGTVSNYVYGIALDSPFWTANAPAGTFEYRNRTYPAHLTYQTSDTDATESWRDGRGLLPLWYARADMDVPLWDNNTPGTVGFDSNGDGIPDWWAIRHGFDPFGALIADNDDDSDGISNFWEYRLGTDPNNVYSLDPLGQLTDAQYDSDKDGLSNADEVNVFGTDPSLWDTDDDGYGDGAEVFFDEPSPADGYGIEKTVSSPQLSRSPLIQRSLVAAGRSLVVPFSERFSFTEDQAVVGTIDVTISEPLDGAQIATRFTDVSAQIVSEDPLEAVRIVLNEQVIANLGPVASFTRTIIIGSGENVIRVEAVNTSGGVGSATVTVTGTFAPADIRVTQTWNRPGDLDTWLVDPQGRHMGWTQRGPGLPDNVAERIPGSFLDIDDIPGVGPENITVERGSAIDGDYPVWMNNFSNGDSPDSTVMVLVHEGQPNQQFRQFGPRSMPVRDGNGNDPEAWWNTTTVNWPSGDMNPPGEPVSFANDEVEDVETGFGASLGWTLEAWVRPGTTNQTGAVMAYRSLLGDELFSLGLENNTPVVRLRVSGGVFHEMRAGALPAGEWTHLAAVFSEDQKGLRLFVNGFFAGARQVLQTRDDRRGTLYLDTYAGANTAAVFTATHIDDVRVWGRARNGGLINSWMRRHTALSSSLVAYYAFDDGGMGIEDFTRAGNREYGPGGVTLPDARIDAKPGPDGDWGTADDIAAGAGADGHNDYVTHTQWAWVFGEVDTDEDGLPDWWETMFFADAEEAVADEDTDGDGLTNLNEYRIGTNPLDADTDGDGRADGAGDFSGNGLDNALEQEHGTDIRLWDTDNDGLSDGDEVADRLDPLDSLVPLTNRVLILDGQAGSYASMAHEERFALTNWVVEAWIHPTVAGGEVISRQVQAGRYNYRLALLPDGRPEVSFNTAGDGSVVAHAAAVAVPLNAWTHLRGGFDFGTHVLYVEINGIRYSQQADLSRSPLLFGNAPYEVRVGRGFTGMMDEVRIWSATPLAPVVPPLALPRVGDADILRHNYTAAAWPLRGNEPGLVGYLRFDDGIIAPNTPAYEPWAWNVVQDFAEVAGARQWENFWQRSARVRGAANVIAAPAGSPADVMFLADVNADGIPDGWQRRYWPGFDPYSGTPGAWDPTADPDEDGLWNLTEFLAGLDPYRAVTGGSGMRDGERDSDGDGLNNLYEQNVSATRVNRVNTDDDGKTDWEEAMGRALPAGWLPFAPVPAIAGGTQISDPLNSLSPPAPQSARFNGNGRIVVSHQERHALRSWTVQAWVRPDAGATGIILRRRVLNTEFNAWGINYELGIGLDSEGYSRPYAQFQGFTGAGVPALFRVDGSQPGEVTGGQQVANRIRAGEWTHVAATYDESARRLSLYINGDLVTYRTEATLPYGLGLAEQRFYIGELTVGGGHLSGSVVQDGFRGYLDDVMLLGGASDAHALLESANRSSRMAAALRAAGEVAELAPVAQSLSEALANPHLPGQILVRFRNEVTATQVKQTLAPDMGVQSLDRFTIVPVHLMQIEDGMTVSQKLAQVRSNPAVLYAEPNFRVRSLRTPNDPMYINQYALANTGQTGGTPDADIGAEDAWDRTTGSRNVRVAVIDTGVDYTHPDLAGNMWSSLGYDFFDNDEDPMDEHGHGTHVAGTIGAVTGNGTGIAGVAWNIELMALRFMGPNGEGSTADGIRAIEYAWMQGARVSNNSWGGGGYSQALYDAIQAAGNAGHLFIASAGNNGMNNDAFPVYPASYNLPNIIAVAASDHDDNRASFSNYGRSSVHLAAPGVNILSTLPGGSYGQLSGTSMAAPHVAGVAALILSMNPGMSHAQIRQLILGSADPLEQWEGQVATGGRLNAAGALGGRGAPVLYLSFNDGGITAEDHTMSADWNSDWLHAGLLSNAVFSSAEAYDRYTDSNQDGIPDWWYEAYGFDPMGASVAAGDDDGDGLSNRYEYLAGTHPRLADSGGNGTTDANADPDGDGLTNLQEQELGTHPLRVDTDDDTLRDGTEVGQDSDPLSAYDPFVSRAMRFSGNGRLLISNQTDMDPAENWTVEAWVRPNSASETGIVVRRAETFAHNGQRWVDYELGLSNNIPYIAFAYRQGTNLVSRRVNAPKAISNAWTHLAGVMDHTDNQFRLYVDGKRVAFEKPVTRPPLSVYGVFETTIGGGDRDAAGNVAGGFRGSVDALRLWGYARSGLELQFNRDVLLPEFDDGTPDVNRAPLRLFNFDSGGVYAHNSRYPRDWMTGWSQAAVRQGDAVFAATEWPPLTLDSDDNGYADHRERTSNWAIWRSEIPFQYQALSFDGMAGSEVLVDELVDNTETMRYALTNWTLEAWVRPEAVPVSGSAPLVRRVTKADGRTTFELGIQNVGGQALPYVRFQRDDGGNAFIALTNAMALPTGAAAWTHLAATFSDGQFVLYVDGTRVRNQTFSGARPYTGGAGVLTLGSANFRGDLQEVRVWNKPRTMEEIERQYRNILLYSVAKLEGSYNGSEGTYLGRVTESREDGLVYDYTQDFLYETIPYMAGRQTHKFTVEAWVKMEPGAAGGIVAERKVDLQLSGSEEGDWRINHSLRITEDGAPQGVWQGQVTILTPIREGGGENEPPVLVGLESEQEVVLRNVTSEIDIRDGKWHHLAVVGDGLQVRLYVDGALDRQVPSYYTFRARGGESFESLYFTYMPIGSELRIADEGLDALVDEVMFWNEDVTEEQIVRHRDYGLDRADIRLGMQPITPLPAFAQDPGAPRHRLVSYLTVDGELEMPFIPDRANEGLPYRIYPQPSFLEVIMPSVPPIYVDRMRNLDRQIRGYFAAVDGGAHAENYMARNDYGYAGQLAGGARFTLLDPATVEHLALDADGDGMPDWWEVLHGLDPGSAVGGDGAHADLDGDGLTNYQEYQAGTDPWNADSAGDGFADYDSRADAYSLTWGERYNDGDGMPEAWEAPHSMPAPNTGKNGPDIGKYDGQFDPDEDGWSSLAEYLGSYLAVTEVADDEGNVTETETLLRSPSPIDVTQYPMPELHVRLRYSGALGDSIDTAVAAERPVQVYFHRTPERDGHPAGVLTMTTGTVVTNTLTDGHLIEGTNYVFAFMDANSNGRWDTDWTNNYSEPAGIAMVDAGWADGIEVEVELTHESKGYWRFAWDPAPGALGYTVELKIGSTVVHRRSIAGGDRTYFHEGDYQFGGLLGLQNATYTALIYARQDFYGVEPDLYHTFAFRKNTNTVSTASVPLIVTPAQGGELIHALNTFAWTMDPYATRYQVEIAATNATGGVGGTLLTTAPRLRPSLDPDGNYSGPLPFLAGDTGNVGQSWSNGTYWMRVRGLSDNGNTPYSAWRSFKLNVNLPEAGGKSAIDGALYYFGRVQRGYTNQVRYAAGETNLHIIVQAFRNAAFAGEPAGQVQVNAVHGGVGSPGAMGAYELKGLPPGVYYLRAFIDMDGDRRLDPFDPWDMRRTGGLGGGYDPQAVDVSSPTGVRASGQRIVLRDHDTDSDGLADAWEYSWMGTLAHGALDDPYSTGSTLLEKYLASGVLLFSPLSEFTFSPAVSDRVLMPIAAMGPEHDSDGDGMSDLDELIFARTNPNDLDDVLRLLAQTSVIPAGGLPGDGSRRIVWQGKAGVRYVVRSSTDLVIWNHRAEFEGAGTHVFEETDNARTRQFYVVEIR